MTPQQFEKYCVAIRDTAVWGGEPEILALSRAFAVPIHVIQSGSPPIVEHNPSLPGRGHANKKAARISYHRRMYGLGEVRVQPISATDSWSNV
jgi:OTU domain-containing protein 6